MQLGKAANFKNINKRNIVATNTIRNPENNKENLVTRLVMEITLKIDCIAISQKHKKPVSKTRVKGIDNANQISQRMLIQMDIALKIKVNPNNDEVDKKNTNYNLNDLSGNQVD